MGAVSNLLTCLCVALCIGCGDNKLSAVPLDSNPAVVSEHCIPMSGSKISLHLVAHFAGTAVLVTSPPDDPRSFVVMREGTIRIIKDDEVLDEPFLDLSSDVYLEHTVERGLVGLAFHPNYAENRQFFVFYTTEPGNVLARCTVRDDDRDRADSCTPILLIEGVQGIHNSGMLEFGRDGYLYVSTGDGAFGDPGRRAQNPYELHGKMLRLDVDQPSGGREYGIPPSNPFADNGEGRPEVYMLGMRNPWRWSFDRLTGDMWIGDVGASRTEELTVLRPHQQAGANLGWSIYEGTGCCEEQNDSCTVNEVVPCDPTGLVFPQDTRDRTTPHGEGWNAIIAGQVYRGVCFPDIVGYHFYSDLRSEVVTKARLLPDDTLELHDMHDARFAQTTSIHAGAFGELYVTKWTGEVFRLEATP